MEKGNAQFYTLVREECRSEDNILYTAYGIDYHNSNGVQVHLGDVSCEEPLVSKMVEMFNICELPPDRLKSAILALLP